MPKQTKDQKRKKKLQDKSKKAAAPTLHAPYFGEKYKSEALKPVLFKIESRIHEFSHECPELSENDLRSGLRRQILRLNLKELKPIESGVALGFEKTLEETVESILSSMPTLSKPKMTGVLRTILGSIETQDENPNVSGYLEYIEHAFHHGHDHVHTENCNH